MLGFRGAMCALAVVACALTVTGCGYALAGRGNALPATIKIIGVPDFVNRSVVPDFDRALTDAVREEFQGKGGYTTLPTADGVDGLLIGTISSVVLQPATFTAGNQVARYRIVVTAAVEFREVATNKIIWANPAFQLRDEYPVTTSVTPDPNAVLTQDRDALQRIARAFARSVVTSVFEAF